MRRDEHVVGLSHCRDLLSFRQTASVTDIRLNDIYDLLFDQAAETLASVQTLTSGQRCVGSFGNFLHGTNIKGIARLFDPGDAQVFIAFAQTDSFRGGHAAAEVDVNFGLASSDFHQFLHALIGELSEVTIMESALNML
ncbi:hypothetical protein D3C87_1326720 [compost metagenome]